MTSAVDSMLAHMGIEMEDELKHYGKKGMKWGVRKRPDQLDSRDSDTEVTKKVKADYNNLNDQQFMNKYATSKDRYAKRVEKHGDPYAAKNSAKDRETLEARDRQTERGLELQRQAFKTYAANGEKAAAAALRKYEKMEKDALEHPDSVTAARMTKGEKIASSVMLGVYGSLALGAIALSLANN